jgi:hypothetical protein
MIDELMKKKFYVLLGAANSVVGRILGSRALKELLARKLQRIIYPLVYFLKL